MGDSGGRHRKTGPAREHRLGSHRETSGRSKLPLAGMAAVAVAGAALLGVTPALTAAPALLAYSAPAYYVRGTNIGYVPPDSSYAAFADNVIDQTAGGHQPAQKIQYPAGFWPVSKGYFADPTFNNSVRQGLASLHSTTGDTPGVIIYGYSQGAAVVTRYKREVGEIGDTYVLVANPNRPNGGILQRFRGLNIPILDVSFNGSTPTDGDVTYDIARQYDGVVDFPQYPLNLLATANALLGFIYLHGKYDTDIDPADLNDPAKTDKQVYQNTTYYLIHTDRLPLLMPLEGILPDAILDALDAPLRVLVELGYDRTKYGKPTKAGLIRPVNPFEVGNDLIDATKKGLGIGSVENQTPASPPQTNAVPSQGQSPRLMSESADPPGQLRTFGTFNHTGTAATAETGPSAAAESAPSDSTTTIDRRISESDPDETARQRGDRSAAEVSETAVPDAESQTAPAGSATQADPSASSEPDGARGAEHTDGDTSSPAGQPSGGTDNTPDGATHDRAA